MRGDMFRMCIGGGDHRLRAELADDISRSTPPLPPFMCGPDDQPFGSVMPPLGLETSRFPGDGG